MVDAVDPRDSPHLTFPATLNIQEGQPRLIKTTTKTSNSSAQARLTSPNHPKNNNKDLKPRHHPHLTMPSPPPLPTPGPSFTRKKTFILSHLALPDAEYTDASPKGSVDEGIRALLAALNARDGLVTTSSCAGRVSVYLEGQRKKDDDGDDGGGAVRGTAAVGGKGGGEWLFVSHDPLGEGEGWRGVFGFEGGGERGEEGRAGEGGKGEGRLIHFKFEPMVSLYGFARVRRYVLTRFQILHVLTASPEHAQLVIQAGMGAGFRETGAVSVLAKRGEEEAMPMVAVRSMGLSFESLVGVESEELGRRCIVSDEYLDMIVRIANERFVENAKRIARLEAALDQAFAPKGPEGWEDAETRKERKREEGLRRREELKRQQVEQREESKLDLDLILQAPDIL